MTTTTLVVGATGYVGGHAVAELAASGRDHVRALVRDVEAAGGLGAGVDVVPGRLEDRHSVRAALEGVDRVLLCVSNSPTQAELEIGLVDAAVDEGVDLLVKVSALGADLGSAVAFWDQHGRIEQHLLRTGLPAVVLQPSTYATNFLGGAALVAGAGALFEPAGSAAIAVIDPRDVASAAVAILTQGGHQDNTYVLTGPEALTLSQVADRLGRVLGREIGYVDVPDAAARQAMLESGMPEWVADQIVAVWRELRAGVASSTTDQVEVLTGRPARTVEDFFRDHAAAFGG